MNLRVLLRRIFGMPTLETGIGTTIGRSARILNSGKSSKQIRVGDNSRIEGELFIFAHGGQITIGDWCFVGPGTRIWSAIDIQIGHRVLISHSVSMMDSLTHPIQALQRHKQFQAILKFGHPDSIVLGERRVIVHDDAWIGAAAIILRGVTVGKGAIVGAGAIVTKDVPAYTVVAGNPARVIRTLAPDER